MQKYKLTLSVERSVVMAFRRVYEGRNISKFVARKMEQEIDKILSEVTDDKQVYTNLERAYLSGNADLLKKECLKRRNKWNECLKKNQHI